jgi:hypothetical protein
MRRRVEMRPAEAILFALIENKNTFFQAYIKLAVLLETIATFVEFDLVLLAGWCFCLLNMLITQLKFSLWLIIFTQYLICFGLN